MTTSCAIAVTPPMLDRGAIETITDTGIDITVVRPLTARLAAYCHAQRPDVAVASIDLSDGPLEPTIPTLVRSATRVIVISDDPSDPRVPGALLAGATGCAIGGPPPPDELARAIHQVAAGDAVLHPVAAQVVLRQWRRATADSQVPTAPGRCRLTTRETEVLQLAADGLTNVSISTRLGVSVKTVESHKSRIFAKLGTSNQAAAVAAAIRSGLLTADGGGPQ